MNLKKLEPGHVLELNEAIVLDNRNVYAVTTNGIHFDIGTIPWDNTSWFEQSNRIKLLADAKSIVYIKEREFSLKHLTSPIDEWQSLSRESQEDILNKYCEMMAED